MKAEGHKRSYCYTHTKHESKVEFYCARLLSRCCWWAVPKAPRMPAVNWPCNRIKIEQQHVVFPNRHSWLFWGAIELGGVVLPEGVHFGQHRGDDAITEIFLFTCALPCYFLQKNEIGDEVRNILGTTYLSFLYVFRCRESTGNSFAAMKQIGSRRHFQVSLTYWLWQNWLLLQTYFIRDLTDSLTRTSVCYCLCLCQEITFLGIVVIIRCHCNLGLMVPGPCPTVGSTNHQSEFLIQGT